MLGGVCHPDSEATECGRRTRARSGSWFASRVRRVTGALGAVPMGAMVLASATCQRIPHDVRGALGCATSLRFVTAAGAEVEAGHCLPERGVGKVDCGSRGLGVGFELRCRRRWDRAEAPRSSGPAPGAQFGDRGDRHGAVAWYEPSMVPIDRVRMTTVAGQSRLQTICPAALGRVGLAGAAVRCPRSARSAVSWSRAVGCPPAPRAELRPAQRIDHLYMIEGRLVADGLERLRGDVGSFGAVPGGDAR